MQRFIISFGEGRGIASWGFMVACGIIACLGLFWFLCKRSKTREDTYRFYSILAIISAGMGIFGAWAFQQIYRAVAGLPVDSSMTFMGGVIFGVVTFLVGTIFFAKQSVKNDLLRISAIAAPSVLIALAFGRTGCLMGGCCYGLDASWGIMLRYGSGAGRLTVPTQVFEGVFAIIMSITLVVLFLKGIGKYNIGIAAASYAVFRFFLEYGRGDAHRDPSGLALTPSQIQSIVLLAVAIVVIVLIALKVRVFYREIKSGASEDTATVVDTGEEKETAHSSFHDEEVEVVKKKPPVKNPPMKDFKNSGLLFKIGIGSLALFIIIGFITLGVGLGGAGNYQALVAMAFLFTFGLGFGVFTLALLPERFTKMQEAEMVLDPIGDVSLVGKWRGANARGERLGTRGEDSEEGEGEEGEEQEPEKEEPSSEEIEVEDEFKE